MVYIQDRIFYVLAGLRFFLNFLKAAAPSQQLIRQGGTQMQEGRTKRKGVTEMKGNRKGRQQTRKECEKADWKEKHGPMKV